MENFFVTLGYQKSCPYFGLINTTDFPVESDTHLQSDFNQFAKIYINFPNDVVEVYSTLTSKNHISPPSDTLTYNINTCLSGIFKVKFISLPTPRSTDDFDTSVWNEDECFYYQGSIYKVLQDGFEMPSFGKTNDEALQYGLSNSYILEIEEKDVTSYYSSDYYMQHWCEAVSCFKKKLNKINCIIVKEPLVDLCKEHGKLLDEVLQLYYINYWISLNGDEQSQDYLSNVDTINLIKKFSNYINSICCCKDCGGC